MKSLFTKRFLTAIGFILFSASAFAQVCSGNISGAGKATGSGNICTNQNPIVSISINPSTAIASQGFTVSFNAVANFNNGTQQDITAIATWSSSDTSIATVGALVTPEPITCASAANGTATITALYQGLSDTSTISCLPVPIITTTSLPAGTVGVPYTASINASGGSLPYAWSISSGSLPGWATLNNTSPTATITGTPNASATTSFVVQASDSGANLGTKTFSLTVVAATQQLPTLPQRWVNERESLLASYTNVATINNSATWSCHGSSKGPYAISVAGLNSAIVDTEACRAANGDSAKIVVPHTAVLSQAFSATSYVNFKQTGGDASTSPINITSDNPLPTNDPATGAARDQRVGTYNIASVSGLSRVTTSASTREYKRPTVDVDNSSSPCAIGFGSGTNQSSPSFSAVYAGKSGVGPTGNDVVDIQTSPGSAGLNWNSRVFRTWQSATSDYSQLSLSVSLACSATAGGCQVQYSIDGGTSWTILHSGGTVAKTTYTVDITGATLSSVQVRVCVDAEFTTVQTTSTLTLYDIWTSGTPIAKKIVTVNAMNSFSAPAVVGDLATIWNPDDKAFQGQYTVCGPPLCSAPSTSSFQYLQPSDLLNWMSSSIANRTSVHLTGTGNPHYSWMDYDGQKFWSIKSSTGHPWDINTYTQQFILHWITEDGDSADQSTCLANGFSSCFIDGFAYKRFLVPNPVMPRFLAWGQTYVIDSPGNNTFVRTTNCETAGTATNLNLGPTHAVTFFTMGDALNGGAGFGVLGIQQTLENDYYYGLSGGVYLDREVFQYLYGVGLVQWTFQKWDGTQYVNQQVTTDTATISGGSPTPSFPCYNNILANWIGGPPGAVGNASIPAADPTDAVSQNGIVFSLQKQSPISSISTSGCTTTGVIGAACTLTIDFASDPSFAVNDRFDIVNSVCQGCITTDPNTLNTTWYVATVTSNTSCATCRITVNTYTEFVGNGATASPPGVALHFNHILADQKACCMWTLEETGSGGDMFFGDTNNYHNYRVANVEIRSAFNNPNLIATVLHIAPNGESITPHPPMSVVGCTGAPAQTNCDEPIHIGFDLIWLHAYSFPTVARTVDGITVGAKLNCGWCYVTNSYFADIHADGQESHAISSKAAVGPRKVVNNYVEGSSENIFLSYLPDVQGLPNGYYCDGEIRRNWLNANPFDIMNSGGNIPNGVGKYYQYLLKNRIEFKNACQELIDGNVMGPSAGGVGEQQGSIFGNNSTPNNGTSNPPALGSQSHDVTYSNNIMRHCFNGGYYPSRSPSTDSINFPTLHYAFTNTLMYDCGNITLYGRNSWSGTNWTLSFSDFIQLANRGQAWSTTTVNKDVTPNVTTFVGNCNGTQTGGVATLTCGEPDQTCTILGGVTTCTTPCVAPAGSIGCGIGLQAGDWIVVTSCSDPLYNVAAPQQVPVLSSDPTLTNKVVIYPVPSGAAASVTGCLVGNGYGYPRFTTVSHNTVISNYNFASPVYANKYFTAPQTIGAAGLQKGFTAGAEVMARDWWTRDNVFSTNFAPGTTQAKFIWCAPANLEGTTPNFLGAEELCLDSHSLVFTNNAIAGLQGASGFSASKYREYNCPASLCGANNGVSPPVTDLMNLTNACAGTPDNTCIGFLGNYVPQTFGTLGGTANPANVPDFAPAGFGFDLFSLSPSSYFFAGHAGQASDGTSNAVDLNALYNALGAQIYTCPRACGGGPFN